MFVTGDTMPQQERERGLETETIAERLEQEQQMRNESKVSNAPLCRNGSRS